MLRLTVMIVGEITRKYLVSHYDFCQGIYAVQFETPGLNVIWEYDDMDLHGIDEIVEGGD